MHGDIDTVGQSINVLLPLIKQYGSILYVSYNNNLEMGIIISICRWETEVQRFWVICLISLNYFNPYFSDFIFNYLWLNPQLPTERDELWAELFPPPIHTLKP